MAPEPRPCAEPTDRCAAAARPGGTGGRTSASAPGAPCARTTAPTATRGSFFPHDHARSRAYRWSEDGLAGICDDRQTLCFALAFWNGRDPILKERIFGLTGPRGQPRRGRQGVLVVPRLDADALVDALALHVPAGRVPLRAARRRERARAARTTPSSSSSTPASSTTAATGRSRPTTRRPSPEDILRPRHRSATPAPSAATIDVLPTLWFRNTWSWGDDGAKPVDPARERRARRRARRASARACLVGERRARGALLRERDERRAALRRREPRRRTRRTASTTTSSTAPPPSTRSRPGTKAAFRYRLEVAAGETATIELRLGEQPRPRRRLRRGDGAPASARPTSSTPSSRPPAPPPTRRSSCARRSPGCSGRKQFFHYDVAALARRRPGRPAAAASRGAAAATASGRT